MSRPAPAQSLRTPPQPTLPSARPAYRRPPQPRIPSHAHPQSTLKPKPATAVNGKPLRTSKTTEKLVFLPSAPQTRPLLVSPGVGYPGAPEEDVLGYETDAGLVREHKSAAERMSKAQREKAGYNRITAYCVAEGTKMKLLAGFLKREHNVHPRVFDEAMYVMYYLPLLPGYSPSTTVRSSTAFTKTHLNRLSEAEENGYQGSYFATPRPRSREGSTRREDDGFVTEGSPIETRRERDPPSRLMFSAESEADAGGETEADGGFVTDLAGETEVEHDYPLERDHPPSPTLQPASPQRDPEPELEQPVAEVIFFAYGVTVFYGFSEVQERSIIDDLAKAGIFRRMIKESDWEIEECHFAIDSSVPHPRIYNDFFTFKSPSHLLKLSIAHALAQSTLLAMYETTASRVLLDPLAVSIPRQLVESGALSLKRRDALRLTGRLFKLRRDVNLVSNVLDVPELFWTEASLGGLYESVREYMEVEGRVRALNEKLLVTSDFLDVIHDHLNDGAMVRITWIVIWYCLPVPVGPFTDAILLFRLILFTIFVEMGEVIARYIVDTASPARGSSVGQAVVMGLMPRGGLVKLLFRVIDAAKGS
ncbi:putative ACR, YagE family COG1723 domain containing protein [Tylopilus felleus]